MGKILISREKTEEIQNVYQRKYSVNDLCVLLASKNELIKEGNLFYERLIKDNLSCLNELEAFWDNIKKEYNIKLQEGEELYLNFNTSEVYIQKIQN